jgi:hypothetical protein
MSQEASTKASGRESVPDADTRCKRSPYNCQGTSARTESPVGAGLRVAAAFLLPQFPSLRSSCNGPLPAHGEVPNSSPEHASCSFRFCMRFGR